MQIKKKHVHIKTILNPITYLQHKSESMNCQTEISTGSDPEIPISLNTETKQASENESRGHILLSYSPLRPNTTLQQSFTHFYSHENQYLSS